jgi:glycosyltransferase involved in cell wall biosynthesis
MTERPLVSIVTPSMNQGQFIEATIRSILAQDYPNIEHIVCDGGSTDETLSVLERYRDRLSYTSGPDGGQAAAINQGFARAGGHILTWLNSDDVYVHRDAVSTMVREFHRQPDVDFVYGDFVEIDERGVVRKVFLRPGWFSRRRLLRVGYISQPATFFRRRVVEALPIANLRYAMDLEYWLRASAAGYRFSHVRKVVAAERVHGAAKCLGEAQGMQLEARAVRERFGHRFDWRHRVGRAADKGLFAAYRVASLVVFARLLGEPPSRLAVDLQRPPLPRAWLYQLGLVETL